LNVNDAVLVNLDEVDREKDATLGYVLPLSLGIVEKLNPSQGKVFVCWMFGENWTSDWKKWVCPKTKIVSKDWIDEDSIVMKDGQFLIVKLLKHTNKTGYFTIDDDSVSDILQKLQ
jgi:hypothetical protein